MQRSALLAVALLLVPAHTALADACSERVAQLIIADAHRRLTRSHILYSEPKGDLERTAEMLWVAWDHNLQKPIDPPGPWILAYDGAMYLSSDEGASWTQVQSFDKEARRAESVARVTALSQSVRDAVCSQEELDGVIVDTFEAQATNPEPHSYGLHHKFWVHRDTGFVARSRYHAVVSEDYESIITYTWTPDDDLVLPVPE